MRQAFRTIFRSYLALVALCVWAPVEATDDIDLVGREFTTAILPAFTNAAPDLVIVSHSDTGSTMVIVEWPAGVPTFIDTLHVPANSHVVEDLPTGTADWPLGYDVNSISVRSDGDISLIVRNNRDTTGSSAIAFPHDALDTSYWVTTNDGIAGPPGIDAGQFIVLATAPGTQVTIHPANDLASGQLAGVPFMLTLGVGEGFFARSASSTGTTANLSGTRVSSSAPVAVVEGNRATSIPLGGAYLNPISESSWPSSRWYTECVITSVPAEVGTLGTYFCIQGAEPGTVFSSNPAIPGLPGSLEPGQYSIIGPLSGDHWLQSNAKPFKVTQLGRGILDPPYQKHESLTIPGTSQYSAQHEFALLFATDTTFARVTIIADTSARATLEVDGVPLGSGAFSLVGSTAYAVAKVALPAGHHTTYSPNGKHAVLVHEANLNLFNMFAYPAGALFEDVCPMTLTGDVNDNGTLGPSDIIVLVNTVFKAGPAPLPCTAAGDLNCSGGVTASDIIELVNLVFKGGSPACDVCSGPLASGC